MMQGELTVLGIETSCDETAVAVVRLEGGRARVLGERIASQTDDHLLYGGIVPEIAARAHVERLDSLIGLTVQDAGIAWDDLDGVAATSGPGLIGGVMAGLSAAKAIALAHDIPLMAVNHLEGHALSPRLAAEVDFPYLLLLVSGGHCQFLQVEDVGHYRRLGSTIDDAVGEAFDKIAKMLQLSGQGGPAVERAARDGDASAVPLPRPLMDRPGLDMSFSGLKTAVRRAIGERAPDPRRVADICASFQEAVTDILTVKSGRAMAGVKGSASRDTFVVAGGVAANRVLRSRLEEEAHRQGFAFFAPPLRWCTDNAAMIALAGAERLGRRLTDALDTPARARWPLDEASAATAPVYGSGRKGAKA